MLPGWSRGQPQCSCSAASASATCSTACWRPRATATAACWPCMASLRRQDRAARLRDRGRTRLPGRPHSRSRRRDGAPVRGDPAALLAEPRAHRAPAGSPAGRARSCARAERRTASESVPRGARGPQPVVGGRRGATPPLRRRRRGGSTVRLRMCLRSSPAVFWPRRSRWSSGRGSRSTRSPVSRSFTSSLSAVGMRGRCSSRSRRRGSTSACWSGSASREELGIGIASRHPCISVFGGRRRCPGSSRH
jgi:hypothetical protein